MLITLALALAAVSPVEDRPVSFLVVITDDQRNDMLGCAGHPVLKTPAMDELAARGARFENAFVTTPICAASRASILASRHEATHGFTFGTPPIPKEITDEAWPLRLRAAGWRTAHIGKWGMKTAVKPKTFFDTFQPMGAPYRREQADGTVKHLTNITGDKAIAFLDGLGSDDGFALTVSFNAPHAEDPNPLQYIWPDEESSLYVKDEIALPALANEAAFAALPEFLQRGMGRKRWGWRFDTEEKRVSMTRGHYRMISGVDRNLGRIVTRLKELGRADDTVVLLLGDNGYFLGERGLAGKWLIYEEAIRVPLIVCDPRVPMEARGRLVDAMALNIDIGPTVLGLARLETPAGYEGRSLEPWLTGKADEWRHDFLVEHHMDNELIAKHRGVRGERYVYSVFYEQDPPFEWLFDLESDPLELVNLAADPAQKDRLQELRERTAALSGTAPAVPR